jgi:hypothetical protein
MDYSKLSEEELLAEIKKIDDWEKLPLPISWYKKYNLPAPKPVAVPQYVKEMPWLKSQYNQTTNWEVRTEPAPGGVRPIVETDLPTVELTDSKFEPINTLINEIVSDNQQQMQREREGSTEHNTTNSQPVLGH